MSPAFLAASCGGGGGGGDVGGFAVGDMTDEEAIRPMDEFGQDHTEQGDFDAVYALFEPDFRDVCPFEPFARISRLGNDIDEIMRSHPRDGEIVDIQIYGDRAVVTSLDYSPARDELDEETDEVVKIDGRWFVASDAEGIEACGSALASEDYYTDATSATFRMGLMAGAVTSGSVDPLGLYLETFSSRFQDACPFEQYNALWPDTSDRFARTFDDPYGWEYTGDGSRVEISADQGPVAVLVLEGGGWLIDEIAGLDAC